MTHDRAVKSLRKIFEEERQSLLRGDLTRLGQLADRKDSLVTALKKVDLPEKSLTQLSELSARNQLLIDAARAGINAAKVRIALIQRGAPVETYSKSGEKSEFSKPVRTLHRRA